MLDQQWSTSPRENVFAHGLNTMTWQSLLLRVVSQANMTRAHTWKLAHYEDAEVIREMVQREEADADQALRVATFNAASDDVLMTATLRYIHAIHRSSIVGLLCAFPSGVVQLYNAVMVEGGHINSVETYGAFYSM